MATWPDISLPSKIEEELYKPQVETEFEANYFASRPISSRAIRRWNLSWNSMSQGDLDTLQTFFIANQGLSFDWTNPRNSIGYSCRFIGDSIKANSVGISAGVYYWTVNCIYRRHNWP